MSDEYVKDLPADVVLEVLKQLLDNGEFEYAFARVNEDGEHETEKLGVKCIEGGEAFQERIRNDPALQVRLKQLLNEEDA